MIQEKTNKKDSRKEKDSQGKESESVRNNKHRPHRDLTQSEELNLAIEESLHTPESEKSDRKLDSPAARDEPSRSHKGECLYCGLNVHGGQDDMEVHWLTECSAYKEF